MAALPPPVGWKLIAVATPIGPAGAICMPFSVIGSRRGTPNCVDAAVVLPLGADDLIELGGVEIDRRAACRRAGGVSGVLLAASAVRMRGRHLHRIAVAADMHVEGRRIRRAAGDCERR